MNKADVEARRDELLKGNDSLLRLDDQPGLGDDLLAILLPAIEKSPGLINVYVGNIGVGHEGVIKIAQAAAKNPTVTGFTLQECKKITDGDAAAVGICKAFESSKALEEIEFRYQANVTDVGVKNGLAHLVATSQSLQKFSLTNCQVGFDGMNAISKALCANKNSKVTEIDLSNQWPDDESAAGRKRVVEGFFAGITSPLPHLDKIDLGHATVAGLGATALAAFLGSANCKLTKLILSNVTFEAATVGKVFEAIGKSSTIAELELRSAKLDEAIGVAALKGLVGNKSIKILDLNYAEMNEKALAEFAKFVAKSTTIENVDIPALKGAALKDFLSALQDSKSLKSASFSLDDPKDAEKAATAIEKNKSLRIVDVGFSLSETSKDGTYTSSTVSVYFREGDTEVSVFTDELFEKHKSVLRVKKAVEAVLKRK